MDELQYIEREAREQGEADARQEMIEAGECLECCGTGYIMTGWRACGLAPMWDECPECGGTGNADPMDEAAYYAEARHYRM